MTVTPMLLSVNVGLPKTWPGRAGPSLRSGPAGTPADGEVLICCAQPRAEIVLDI